MPKLKELGFLEAEDLSLTFNKGPGQNIDEELVLSEEASKINMNVFDVLLKAYISSSKMPPTQLKRDEIVPSFNQAKAPSQQDPYGRQPVG